MTIAAQNKSLKAFLDQRVELYNQPSFIAKDPVSIPHRFTKKQDIEIAGFFSAIFSWGNRTTIINKSIELIDLMDNAPFDFVINHQEKDLVKFTEFVHRTFNSTDLLYFIDFLHNHYSGKIKPGKSIHRETEPSLESAFSHWMDKGDTDTGKALQGFHQYFFSSEDAPHRTKKHIATPDKNSSCKRLNMFLRWMVRKDKKGVDFGIWKSIKPEQLVCPLDLHVAQGGKKIWLAYQATGRLDIRY